MPPGCPRSSAHPPALSVDQGREAGLTPIPGPDTPWSSHRGKQEWEQWGIPKGWSPRAETPTPFPLPCASKPLSHALRTGPRAHLQDNLILGTPPPCPREKDLSYPASGAHKTRPTHHKRRPPDPRKQRQAGRAGSRDPTGRAVRPQFPPLTEEEAAAGKAGMRCWAEGPTTRVWSPEAEAGAPGKHSRGNSAPRGAST